MRVTACTSVLSLTCWDDVSCPPAEELTGVFHSVRCVPPMWTLRKAKPAATLMGRQDFDDYFKLARSWKATSPQAVPASGCSGHTAVENVPVRVCMQTEWRQSLLFLPFCFRLLVSQDRVPLCAGVQPRLGFRSWDKGRGTSARNNSDQVDCTQVVLNILSCLYTLTQFVLPGLHNTVLLLVPIFYF